MNIDEMKNKISMALKDQILQQGFEIICKENTELKEENKVLAQNLEDTEIVNKALEKENAELKKLLNCDNCSELSEDECECCAEYSHFKYRRKDQFTKAKELIKKLIEAIHIWDCKNLEQVEAEAEQFLKDSEVEK